jgi:hypothetical protein
MILHQQQGGSTLAAVMLLLVMGLMLLNAQHRQMDSTLLLAAGQQRYLQAYNQAASSLSWGMVQTWPTTKLNNTGWFCQRQAVDDLRACARLSSRVGIVLLRGRGGKEGDEPLWLYQLTTPDNVGGLIAEKGGWLDFCPEKQEDACAG